MVTANAVPEGLAVSITRRDFLKVAVPAALILPVAAEELLHPGRKFFLPPRKLVHVAGPPTIVVPRVNRHLIEHSYIGADGRFHKSNFWVRSEDVAGLSAAITEGVIKNLGRQDYGYANPSWLARVVGPTDSFESLPTAQEKVVVLC
jgi:hypothetical protein